MNNEIMTVIGLMSGTSLDGIDVAVLRTDGRHYNEPLFAGTYPYEDSLRNKLRACFGQRDELDPVISEAEIAMTRAHAAACEEALAKFPETSLIGFHGQTIWHAPQEGRTRQLGNGPLLADLTRRPVIYDLRSNDMRAGGQGAPLLPLYHAARVQNLQRPIAVVNIGGVGNVTWIGAQPDEILAFDTGPGNALLNDWLEKHTGSRMDENGATAAKGTPDMAWIKEKMAHEYFMKRPPKSLDRDDFQSKNLPDWSLEDGAATLTLLTTHCIAASQNFFPQPVQGWVIAGGGRHNPVMMTLLRGLLRTNVIPCENIGWNGDALEAEGFAYLAARSFNGLPTSLPQTTGCATPTTGGILVRPTLSSTAA